jgi:phage terminase large subunit-like protein
VIGDWSKRVAGYEAAIRAWEMYRVFSANWLVVEDNVAKKWLRDTLVLAYQDLQKEGLFPSGGSAPIRTVTAKVNKRLRAEPVAARYEQKQGMVRHAGRFGDLETQMCSWVPDTGADSPDRVDAVVYALLKLDSRSMGRVADPRDAQIQRGLPTGAAPMGAGLPAGPYG